MHEMVKSFDIPAPKLPDYNLGEVFQNVTPNYTIPDHALRGLDSPTYPKDSWQQLIILGNGFEFYSADFGRNSATSSNPGSR